MKCQIKTDERIFDLHKYNKKSVEFPSKCHKWTIKSMTKIFSEQFILYELHKGNIFVNQKFKMAKYLISAKIMENYFPKEKS